MQIGKKIKRLRLKKGLTQEELGERTDLTKGFISQLERDINSPSIETLFSILNVLGSKPKDFFDDEQSRTKVVFREDEQTIYLDEEKKYKLHWLISESNENEMEPVLISLDSNGQFKQFEPSLSETFIYVLQGEVSLTLGKQNYTASAGESLYFEASDNHLLKNASDEMAKVIYVVTNSYL
ncbi:transcriptional regulator, XRE family with cupin sensor [Psychrobacillus sp. OK028]|uniref:helix-turn-helix domain-containing protein n=1 Tax=Psychrobacillus sp. OK028 TaxID=1884359 RepID=UPI00088E38FC|nr:XRE family transcriptional regulator [Psychrobacillus sp. OK028]SDM49026.1 transcriptional regulator, XRE family with cupin sensor [Psychrobacillus sp. OK028]